MIEITGESTEEAKRSLTNLRLMNLSEKIKIQTRCSAGIFADWKLYPVNKIKYILPELESRKIWKMSVVFSKILHVISIE